MGYLFIFTVQAVIYAAAFAFLFGLLGVVVIPLMVWLFTYQLQWATFSEWLGYTLLGVSMGIMGAAMLTVIAWGNQTRASVITKTLVFVLLIGLSGGGGIYSAKAIRSYVYSHYPPEISADVATKNISTDAPNPYISLTNSGGNNTIGGIPISSPSPTNPNRAK